MDVGLAQARQPLCTRSHYFEVEIVDPGEKCYIALGLARRVSSAHNITYINGVQKLCDVAEAESDFVGVQHRCGSGLKWKVFLFGFFSPFLSLISPSSLYSFLSASFLSFFLSLSFLTSFFSLILHPSFLPHWALLFLLFLFSLSFFSFLASSLLHFSLSFLPTYIPLLFLFFSPFVPSILLSSTLLRFSLSSK